MTRRITFWQIALTALIGVPLASNAVNKPVMVHYMPWFQAKPFSGSWGYHWTLGSGTYNPDEFYAKLRASRLGER